MVGLWISGWIWIRWVVDEFVVDGRWVCGGWVCCSRFVVNFNEFVILVC